MELEVSDRVERIIWKGIGKKSARALAEETGLTPDQVFAIKARLLEAVDEISVQQTKQKLVITLQEIIDKAYEDYDNVAADFKSGLLNSAISASKAVLTELNRVSKQDTERLNSLNEMRVRELTSLMFEVVDATVPLVAERYGIPQDELFDMFNDSLSKAAARRDLEQ